MRYYMQNTYRGYVGFNEVQNLYIQEYNVFEIILNAMVSEHRVDLIETDQSIIYFKIWQDK